MAVPVAAAETDFDEHWMRQALAAAREAQASGEVPVGTCVVSENKLIAEADTLTAQSLPGVKMPNASGFTSPDPRPDAP